MTSAIVTGAAGDMGQAICHALANAGLRVIGVDRAAMPDDVIDDAVTGDVRDEGVIRRAFKLALEGETEVFLVNNAGVTVPGAPQTKEAWDQTLDVNLTAPFQLTQALLPAMVERGWGRIVNISSIGGSGGLYQQAGYAATISALDALDRPVQELRRRASRWEKARTAPIVFG